MSKMYKFFEDNAAFLVGFGLVGMADGWNKIFAIIAAAGIILIANRRRT